MTDRHPLDPESPAESAQVEALIGRALAPESPNGVLAAEMRSDLMARVRRAHEAAAALTTLRLGQGVWQPVVRGVRSKRLGATGRGFLVEIDPGASLPMHRHHEEEECVVLRGTVELDGLRVSVGDYHVAPAGSRHGRVRSEAGALIYLRGTPIGDTGGALRDLVTGLLPGRGDAITRRLDGGGWKPVSAGVDHRLLHERNGMQSTMLRFAPGSLLELAPGPFACESLVIDGELFFGRDPAGPGDHVAAPGGGRLPELASDRGATVFVRGAQILKL